MNIEKVAQHNFSFAQQIIKSLIDNAHKQEQVPSALHIQTLLSDERTYLYAAIDNNMVLGYILAYRFPSLYASAWLAYLYDIEVREDCRRKGIATHLLSVLFNQLKTDGVTEVWLGTGTDNNEAQAFYTATGGIKTGETFNDCTYYL